MSVALTLDTIAHRYGVLPSQVLQTADTLDLWVMDIALAYHHYKSNPDAKPQYSQQDLQQILKKAKGK